MTLRNHFLRLALLMVAAAAMLGGVSAAEGSATVDVSMDDKIIWLNSQDAGSSGERTFDARLFCSGDFTAGSSAEIIRVTDDGDRLLKRFNQSDLEGTSQIEYTLSENAETGEHKVVGYCHDGNNNTKQHSQTFHVAEMDFEVLRPTYNDNIYRRHFMGSEQKLGDLYEGDPVIIDMNITGAPPQYSPQNQDLIFDVRLSNYANPSGGLDYNFEVKQNEGGRNYRVVLHPFIPKDVPGGHHQVQIDLEYKSNDGEFLERMTTSRRATYLPGIRAKKMNPAQDILYGEVGKINMDMFVEPYYRKYQVSEEDFMLEINGKEYTGVFNLEDKEDSSGKYSLELDTVPELPTEKDKFNINIFFKDSAKESAERFIEIASYDVTSKVEFQGYVRDADQRPVKTEFRVSKKEEYVQFDTLENGFFTKKFEPGNRTFAMKFFQSERKGELRLREVRMKPQYDSKVRFDYTENPKTDIPGIEAINKMSVVFGHPFTESGSTAAMKFDPEGVDPTKVNVFECNKWNFQGERCLSGWKKIPESEVSRNTPQYRLIFPVDPLKTKYFKTDKKVLTSAYVVGKRAGLGLQGGVTLKGPNSEGRLPVDEGLEVDGRVVAGGSNGVAGANVTIAVLDDDRNVVKTFGDTSDRKGFFTADTRIDNPGEYTLEVNASHSSYDGFEIEQDQQIEVYMTEGMELKRPDSSEADITIGEQSRLEVITENVGNTDIESIRLDSGGINSEYVNFSENGFSLEAGEGKTVYMNLMIPQENSLDNFPTITVSASGEGEKGEVESELEIPGVLRSTGTETKESDTKEEKDSNDSSFTTSDVPGVEATGQFLASQSTLNIALGLIMVFLMVLAGAMRKNGSAGRQTRNVMGQQSGHGGRGGRGAARAGNGNGHSRTGVKPPKVSPASQREEGDESKDSGSSTSDEGNEAETEGHEEGEEKEDEDVEKVAENVEEDEESSSSIMCDVCGEEFDTEAGVKLHKETSH